jgi:predicted P-loop ATPase
MKIAVGNSRMDKRWINKDITWENFKKTVRVTKRTTETVSEFRKMNRARQDAIKDVGGFVGGALREGKRRNGYVLCRSLLTLDMDYAKPGVWEQIESLHDWACCAYTTHKHTPEAPRLRLIIPLSREVSEDEYPALGRMVAKEIGIELFDDTTYEASRLMYWPSTPSDSEFLFCEKDGQPLDPDAYLSKYADWRDTSMWPVSSRQSEVVRRQITKQADPLAKEGVVGVFCRAYSIEDAIETFLQDVYEPSALNGRYDYIPADSSAGLVIYDGKFAYSHHATDPACGKLLNAFDLVRIHRFRDLDDKAAEGTPPGKLPSFKAMTELAIKDGRVKEQLTEERRQQAKSEFAEDGWEKQLDLEKNGKVKDTLDNLIAILTFDAELQSIGYNQLRDGIDVRGKLPWSPLKPGWSDSDYASLKAYISRVYSIYSPTKTKDAVLTVATTRKYHPIREYLSVLPPWDSSPRVETLLIDYFGAEDNPYVRTVTRKTLAAAVARVFVPGIKFDSVLVFNGPQGIGKSTLFYKLAGEWFSDSLSLTDMNDKTGAEKLQGYWILEIPEFAGMRKADIEKVKSFISRADDKYRASYGVSVESHPRQCVLIGSVNSDKGFLRDLTGNRRFWPVKTPGGGTKRSWKITENEIEQIWAEALAIWRGGEKLYLEGNIARIALREQADALENDDREGLVRDYLETLLPDNWTKMDLPDRRLYIEGCEFGTPTGTVRRIIVSNLEIWCECFRKDRTAIKRQDSYEISAIMARIGGWAVAQKRVRLPIYGIQQVWERVAEN